MLLLYLFRVYWFGLVTSNLKKDWSSDDRKNKRRGRRS